MPLDDITLKAFQHQQESMKEAMKTIVTTRSLQQANRMVAEIRDSTLNEAQKRNALEDLSRQVVFNLSQVEASPNSIQQVAQAIAPTFRQPQTAQEALVSGDPEQRQRGVEALQLQNKFKLAEIAARAKTKESTLEDFKIRSQFLREFRKDKAVDQNIQTIQSVDSGLSELRAGTRQSLNLAIKSLVSARENGRISETDFITAFPGQSLPRKFSRSAYTAFLNRATKNDVEEMRRFLGLMREGAEKRLRTQVSARSTSMAGALGGNKKDLEDILMSDLGVVQGATESRVVTVERGPGGELFKVIRDQDGHIIEAEKTRGR